MKTSININTKMSYSLIILHLFTAVEASKLLRVLLLLMLDFLNSVLLATNSRRLFLLLLKPQMFRFATTGAFEENTYFCTSLLFPPSTSFEYFETRFFCVVLAHGLKSSVSERNLLCFVLISGSHT